MELHMTALKWPKSVSIPGTLTDMRISRISFNYIGEEWEKDVNTRTTAGTRI